MDHRRIPKQLRVRALALAVVSLTVFAPGASAFNQMYPPDGNPNTVGSCTGSGVSPCIRWAKTADNLSITVDVYLDSNLTSQEVNLKTIANFVISSYNGISARNPHLATTTSLQNEDMYVQAVNLSNPLKYGGTTYSLNSSDRIVYASVKLNTQVEWNTDYNYACRSIPAAPNTVCKADAYKVMHHEFGHAEGLAHEAASVTAIMVQSEPDAQFHTLRADDKNGIIHIYGAWP